MISSIAEKVDLYPYLDLIEAYSGGLEKPEGARYTADLIELRFAPRARRLELLGNAVRFGHETLPRGTTFLRMFAVRFAALQGLDELRPAVAQYLSAHEPARLRRRELHSVPALFELCAGAETLLDAPRIAFSRILEMEEGRLEEHLANDGFRSAFFELAGTATHATGLGGREREAISLLHRVAARQLAYRSQSVRPRDEAPFNATSIDRADWLKQLRQRLGLEGPCF